MSTFQDALTEPTGAKPARCPKNLLRTAINQYRGDNLERAQHAWGGLTPEQMEAFYGESGETRATLLAQYQAHARECALALEWVESQP